jgi:hypothetical protein
VGGAYQPSSLDVQPGETVTFTNDDDAPHTVTSAWDDGATFNRVLRPHESVDIVFQQAGTYVVRCLPHSSRGDDGGYGGMVATLRVVPASAGEAAAPSGFPVLPIAYATLALIAAGALLAWQLRRPRPQP